ncbi:cache domain-containing sensor histidine kinase [Cohnella herbarum]|uniref:histidine kinase n=1 Tax=Cohnella herbarum TaxID=2728023 RepID=A0A7Z2VPA8_9BACL|nr:sensor histidine kinase [Cohnella herbarum]QJD86590.1 sensor histidine kinase [Cohnella herbarum]
MSNATHTSTTKSNGAYIPLRYKLLFSYLILVLTPVIVIGSYSYVSSVRSSEEHTRSNLEIAVKQIGSNVDYRLADVIRGSDDIFTDQALSRILSGYYLDYEKYTITTQYIMPKLESAVNLPILDTKLSVFLSNKNISEFYYISEFYFDDQNGKGQETQGRQYSIFHMDRIVDRDWYKTLPMTYEAKTWKQIEDDVEKGGISFLRPIINYETLSPIGLINMNVKLKDIFYDVDFTKLGDNSMLFVIDGNNHLLYSSSRTDLNPNLLSVAKDGFVGAPDDYMQIKQPITNMNASIVAWIPNSSFQENSEQVRNLTILICMVSLIVMTIISWVMSRYFSKRFMKLIRSLKAFKEGDFHKRMVVPGNDEFSQIGDAFNDMASNMEKLIDEVYLSKLEKKEVELQVLHSQMNPHFLYNTFSSISRMAKLGEIDKMHEMVRGLAKFYRLSLNKGEMIISIDKEVQIIQSYVDIQRIKFADRIIVEYDIDEETLGYDTIKFILQPFVENVLEHAWYDDEIHLFIRVALEGEEIVMEIRDNGIGMKEETIEQVLDPSEKGVGYGIRNVDQRIKLQFGKSYGVSITSSIGEGTTVRIRFPRYAK